MGIVISVANQKGGCGKTTTTINLAYELAFLRKKRVLVIDYDPQGTTSKALGLDYNDEVMEAFLTDNSIKNTADVNYVSEVINLNEDFNLEEGSLNIIPSERSQLLSYLESGMPRREQALSRLIKPLRADYDYIIVDGQPSLGINFDGLVMASDIMLSVIELSEFGTSGTIEYFQRLNDICQLENHSIKKHIILPNREKRNTIESKNALSSILDDSPKFIKTLSYLKDVETAYMKALPQRQAFANALEVGYFVQEYINESNEGQKDDKKKDLDIINVFDELGNEIEGVN
jgi:chromosome partitioning protein